MRRILMLILLLLPSSIFAQRMEVVIGDDGTKYVAVYAYGLPREIVKTNAEMKASVTNNGIMRRHYTTAYEDQPINPKSNSSSDNGYEANSKLSFAFIIAPYNVGVTGEHSTTGVGISWAQASGWNTDVDSEMAELENLNSGIGYGDSVEANELTGCAAYQGALGTDPKGTWRLPTQRESMVMFTIIEQAIDASASGEVDVQIDDGSYWTSTECYPGANAQWKTWVISSSTGTVVHEFRSYANVPTTCFARCIKDIYDSINE